MFVFAVYSGQRRAKFRRNCTFRHWRWVGLFPSWRNTQLHDTADAVMRMMLLSRWVREIRFTS